MNTQGWITGTLLILAAAQTAQAEKVRVPPEAQNEQSAQILKRAVVDDAQARRDKEQQPKQERLSPEERLKLRRDINDAGRDLYQRERPKR